MAGCLVPIVLCFLLCFGVYKLVIIVIITIISEQQQRVCGQSLATRCALLEGEV